MDLPVLVYEKNVFDMISLITLSNEDIIIDKNDILFAISLQNYGFLQ